MIQNECENFVVHNIDVTTVDKILKNLDVAKASGIEQISAKFLKDGAPVIAIHLANMVNLLIKRDTFPSKRKMGIKTDAQNYRPIALLPLISKVIKKMNSRSNTGLYSKKQIFVHLSIRL